jgi:DNA-binding Lrp family transcriptional regulator
MPKDPLLQKLQHDARSTVVDLATETGLTANEVHARIAAWEADGTILGYQAVVDREKVARDEVVAVIEVKLSPERGGGFDRMARRIARFDQVRACYLMSGGYDLAVFIEGHDLREVARFVSEKLSTMEGVLSTSTHFVLKAYKEGGFLVGGDTKEERLSVAP